MLASGHIKACMIKMSAAYALQTSKGANRNLYIDFKETHESWKLPVYLTYCFFFQWREYTYVKVTTIVLQRKIWLKTEKNAKLQKISSLTY